MTEFRERGLSLYKKIKFSAKVLNNRKFSIYIIQGIGIKLDLKLVELKA